MATDDKAKNNDDPLMRQKESDSLLLEALLTCQIGFMDKDLTERISSYLRRA